MLRQYVCKCCGSQEAHHFCDACGKEPKRDTWFFIVQPYSNMQQAGYCDQCFNPASWRDKIGTIQTIFYNRDAVDTNSVTEVTYGVSH